MDEKFENTVKIFLDGSVIPPIDVKFMIKAKGLLPHIFTLTQYELELYSTLLAMEKPLKAKMLANITHVPRTKVYGVMRTLREAGLVTLVYNDVKLKTLPEIWEYWPEAKKSNYLAAREIGLQMYAAKTDMLEEMVRIMVRKAALLEKFVQEVKERETRLQNR